MCTLHFATCAVDQSSSLAIACGGGHRSFGRSSSRMECCTQIPQCTCIGVPAHASLVFVETKSHRNLVQILVRRCVCKIMTLWLRRLLPRIRYDHRKSSCKSINIVISICPHFWCPIRSRASDTSSCWAVLTNLLTQIEVFQVPGY